MSTSLNVNDTLAQRFEIRRKLGSGNMGQVFEVYDQHVGQLVALKTLHDTDSEELYQLKQEFRVLVELDHPNLINLYELFIDPELSFFTMELLSGKNLADTVRRNGNAIDYSEFRSQIVELCDALDFLHNKEKIHRDIKPANILIRDDGRPVLLDFGLVGGLDPNESNSSLGGSYIGSPAYMSPEQALGDRVTTAFDWFSLGVVLYECLTGERPHEGPMFRHAIKGEAAYQPIPISKLNNSVPDELVLLTEGLLSWDPVDRSMAKSVFQESNSEDDSPNIRDDVAPLTFVGRNQDLEWLEEHLTKPIGEECVLLEITGEPGIGKTTLIEESVRDLRSRGLLVLQSLCNPRETVSYQALDGIVDDLSHYLSSLEISSREVLMPRYSASLQRLFPVLKRCMPETAIDSLPDESDAIAEDRRKGFLALREIISRLALRNKLVVWIDNAQWGDIDSLVALREILQPPDSPPILLILSYREAEKSKSVFVNSWHEDDLLTRISTYSRNIGALTEAEEKQLAHRLLPADSANLNLAVRKITDLAAGSPLLIRQLIGTAKHQLSNPDLLDFLSALSLDNIALSGVEKLTLSERKMLQYIVLADTRLPSSVLVSLIDNGQSVLRSLQSEMLVRLTRRDGLVSVEPYHESIRDSFLEQITEDERKTLSGELFDALSVRPEKEDESIAHYAHNAGRKELASKHILLAAEKASSQLAFVKAATLYETAEEWTRLPTDATQFQTRAAESFLMAGRASDAAPLFEKAAASAEEADAQRLSMRAMECYLISGDISAGKSAAAPMMRAVDLAEAMTTKETKVSLMKGMLWLFFRGGWITPKASQVEENQLADLTWSLAKGLVYVSPLEGTNYLITSIRASSKDSPKRYARGLAFVGAGLFSQSRVVAWLGERFLARAEKINFTLKDAYLDGVVQIWKSFTGLYTGDWDLLEAEASRGLRILKDRCPGTFWEQVVAAGLIGIAIEARGDYKALRSLAKEWGERCRDLGDLYGQVLFRQHEMLCLLADGDFDGLFIQSAWIRQHWTSTSGLQIGYCWQFEVMAAISSGDLEDALLRFDQYFDKIVENGAYDVPITRVEISVLEAKLLLLRAHAGLEGLQKDRINNCIKRLTNGRRKDGQSHALLIQASVDLLEDRKSAAILNLRLATIKFREQHMEAYALAASYVVATISSNQEEEVWISKALQELGIKNPIKYSYFRTSIQSIDENS